MTATLTWIADMRSETGPVISQGERGTCLSCACSSAHHKIRDRAKSIEYLHYASSRLPTGTGSLHSAVHVLGTDGQPDEIAWPYDPGVNEEVISPIPPLGLITPVDCCQVKVALGADPAEVVAHLKSGVAPIVGLMTTPLLMALRGGVLTEPDAHLDGHAVLVVGAATYNGPNLGVLRPGDELMCVQNSWGPGWGNGGYGLIGPRAWQDMTLVTATLAAA